MKNNLSILGALITIACAAVSVTGCYTAPVSTQNHEHWGGFGEVLIPVKDFESVGLVFTEVQFQSTSNGAIEGEVFTYQALLKEAQKVGADAIINVTIDKLTQSVTNESAYITSRTKQETWYGSALAIKYTGALTQEQMTQGPLTISPSREHLLDGGVSASSGQPAERTGFGFK